MVDGGGFWCLGVGGAVGWMRCHCHSVTNTSVLNSTARIVTPAWEDKSRYISSKA